MAYTRLQVTGAQGVWTITSNVVTVPISQCQPGITDGGASSKNTPKGIGYMLDAAHGCGGQRTHLEKGCSHGSAGDGYPMRAPIKCGSMIGSYGHLRAFLAGITKKSLGVTRPSVTSTSSWIVSKSGLISPLRMRVTVLTARPMILARSVAVILLRVRYWSNVMP